MYLRNSYFYSIYTHFFRKLLFFSGFKFRCFIKLFVSDGKTIKSLEIKFDDRLISTAANLYPVSAASYTFFLTKIFMEDRSISWSDVSIKVTSACQFEILLRMVRKISRRLSFLHTISDLKW